jgi:hypothetical protein
MTREQWKAVNSLMIYGLVGLISADFLYQGFHREPNWGTAIERAWTQFYTILAVWLGLRCTLGKPIEEKREGCTRYDTH